MYSPVGRDFRFLLFQFSSKAFCFEKKKASRDKGRVTRSCIHDVLHVRDSIPPVRAVGEPMQLGHTRLSPEERRRNPWTLHLPWTFGTLHL